MLDAGFIVWNSCKSTINNNNNNIIMAISGTSATETNVCNEKLLFTVSSMPCHYTRNECLTWGFFFVAIQIERELKQESKILINRFRCHKVNSSSRHSVAFFCTSNKSFSLVIMMRVRFRFGDAPFLNPVVLFMYFQFVIFVLICWSSAYCHSEDKQCLIFGLSKSRFSATWSIQFSS